MMTGFNETGTYKVFPDKVTIRGELDAFDLMLKVPLNAPLAVGLKTTLAVQLAPGA